jgi:hypothetical protein
LSARLCADSGERALWTPAQPSPPVVWWLPPARTASGSGPALAACCSSPHVALVQARRRASPRAASVTVAQSGRGRTPGAGDSPFKTTAHRPTAPLIAPRSATLCDGSVRSRALRRWPAAGGGPMPGARRTRPGRKPRGCRCRAFERGHPGAACARASARRWIPIEAGRAVAARGVNRGRDGQGTPASQARRGLSCSGGL